MAVRILYVEDNPQNMRLVRKFLAMAGYEMLEAINGLSGLAVAAKEHPDLILMDVNLPDIDGLEATSRLKADADLAYIPVVALTANAMHGDKERCIAAGCDGYIPKPVTKSELLNTIAALLASANGRSRRAAVVSEES
jgi:two-component system, cell cycle response regulator DivK